MKRKKNKTTAHSEGKKKGRIRRALFFWRKSKARKHDEPPSPWTDIGSNESNWDEPLITRELSFPGPQEDTVAMRVACDRAPYADLIAHARESLDKEICGVLVGQWGEDAGGVFAHVQAIIRGEAARQDSTHVTFTQETWNKIHETLDREHRKRRIVGWYHTHPGFGVRFSDMDLFIQRNFFSSPYQLALVYDPIAGQTAICVNAPTGIRQVDRFWVDGKEISCASAPVSAANLENGTAPLEAQRLRDLETRVNQLVQANEKLHESISKILLGMFMIVSCAACIWIALSVYDKFLAPETPPEHAIMSNIPMLVNGRYMFLGVELVAWDAPPALQQQLLEKLAAGKENHKNPASNKKQLETTAHPQDSTEVPVQTDEEENPED